MRLRITLALLCAACTGELRGPMDGGLRDGGGHLDARVEDAGGGRDAELDGGAPVDAPLDPPFDGGVDAAPDAGPTRPLRVAVISDLNGSYGSTSYGSAVHAAVARLVALEPDLVLSTGDMVAGQQAGLDYRAMWAAFHAAVSEPLAEAGIPFAVTPGNHDASGYGSFAEERAIFVDEWTRRMPKVAFQDATHYPLRYSFVAGEALFVSLDDTTVGPLSAAQMAWLDAELTRGAAYPVKVVFGHVPLYPFAEGRERDFIGDAALEALLSRHGVSLFLSGHHHAYYPGRRGALRLVSMACVGSGQRALLGTTSVSPRSVVLFEVADGALRELDAFGGATFDQRIERATLPTSVGVGERRIVRDDLDRP